ncbi:MAG TPA: acetyl-CoA hydrolase/transferase C-terminal domain-containing protein [Steroidobacteraceae bacterium]|jgi:acyl-CoA hydrolase
MPEILDDVGNCVEAVLRRVGPRVVLALPLGIGKPNPLVNEFYRRALRDPSIELTIITALSLLKPQARSALEQRLLGPLAERVFGSYVEPHYARAVRAGTVPPNVRVIEFYLAPGAFLGASHAQRNYLCANYTHVARAVLERGVNVIAHLVAQRRVGGQMQLSLSSNPDVTADLLPEVEAARRAGRDIVMVGETHAQLPFMAGHAQVDPERFDFVIDDARYDYDLFAPPNAALGNVDHAIGLYASALVRDGGTLQVGIGELGDALVYALLLRHQQNDAWREGLGALAAGAPGRLVDSQGGKDPFVAGLFASSEMFVDGMLELYRAGVLRRRAYDCLALERALAAGQQERFGADILTALLAAGAGPKLDEAQFLELRCHGVFREDTEFHAGRVRVRGGQWIEADLADPAARERMATQCLGRQLRNGQVLHAGFFLGPRGFYAALRDLPEEQRAQFDMRGVGYVNQLYGADQELRILQRRDLRCINTTMMVTLLGAAVSDALENGQVVSGVGGQYNFVAMAHALPAARSILCVRATRTHQGRTTSNIVWNYAHETIPRHLRDLVITEYGIADLRGRTDEEVIAALLNLADSRFQDELLAQARAAGKIRGDYRIPAQFRANLPQRLAHALQPLQGRGFYSEYPFGTDLTAEEVALVRALNFLEAHTAGLRPRLRTLAAALGGGRAGARHAAALKRMGLERPQGLTEWVQQRLLVLALQATAAAKDPA